MAVRVEPVVCQVHHFFHAFELHSVILQNVSVVWQGETEGIYILQSFAADLDRDDVPGPELCPVRLKCQCTCDFLTVIGTCASVKHGGHYRFPSGRYIPLRTSLPSLSILVSMYIGATRKYGPYMYWYFVAVPSV